MMSYNGNALRGDENDENEENEASQVDVTGGTGLRKQMKMSICPAAVQQVNGQASRSLHLTRRDYIRLTTTSIFFPMVTLKCRGWFQLPRDIVTIMSELLRVGLPTPLADHHRRTTPTQRGRGTRCRPHHIARKKKTLNRIRRDIKIGTEKHGPGSQRLSHREEESNRHMPQQEQAACDEPLGANGNVSWGQKLHQTRSSASPA